MSAKNKEIPEARFEYRTFGRDLSRYRSTLLAHAGDHAEVNARESQELYLLSRTNDTFNCKIRENKMDIKVLLQSKGLLEQWNVYLKAPFPLSRKVLIKEIFPALWTRSPLLEEKNYDLPDVLEITERHPNLQIVSVDKKRSGLILGEIMAEFAEVWVNGAFVETIAVESSNEKEVLLWIKKLGLQDVENINYPRALRRIIGWEGLKVID